MWRTAKSRRQANPQLFMASNTDKDAYRQALQIPSEDTIVLLLIDRMGTIFWRTEGPFDDAKAATLRALLTSRPAI